MRDSATTMLSGRTRPDGMISTEQALARLALNRDALAWSVLIERHGPAILRAAQRATHDRVLCEDICQETLLQIREHAGAFRALRPRPSGTGTVAGAAETLDSELLARGWIMRIACRTALKMIRTRVRSAERESRSVLGVSPTLQTLPPEQPEQIALRHEEQEQVRREVAALPDPHRDAISLRFFADLAYGEIAESLQISEEAAKKRVQRGIDLLRSRLAVGGIALSAATVSGVLQGTAQAAEVSTAAAGATETLLGTSATDASNATTSTVTELFFDESRRAAWQALMNTSQAPALSGIATEAVAVKSLSILGGLSMSGKVGAGIAAAVIAGLGIGGAIEIRASRQVAEDALSAAHASTLYAKSLERKVEDSRVETDSLRRLVESRNSELTSLRDKVADMGKTSGRQHGFANLTPTIRAFPGGGGVGLGAPGGAPVVVTGQAANIHEIAQAETARVLALIDENNKDVVIQKDGNTTTRHLKTANGDVMITTTTQADVLPFNVRLDPPGGAPAADPEQTRANAGETPQQTLEKLKNTPMPTVRARPPQRLLIHRDIPGGTGQPHVEEKNAGDF